MLCKKPFMAGNVPFGCGQCLPCRINRRRVWSWRMYLESLMHKDSCFVTLTYSPEKLPNLGSLEPDHARLFMYRLRSRLSPQKLRFFLCGEYGDQSERPHYHAILFGVGVSHAELIGKVWGKGHVGVYECNQITCQYTAGYVTKKMTSFSDPRLGGRYPEFARMSNRPGIGAPAMEVLREQIFSQRGVDEFHRVGDVPKSLRLGRVSLPLGRYLRDRLRLEIGMPDRYREKLKDAFTVEKSAEVLALFAAAKADPKLSSESVSGVLVKMAQGKVASIEARSRLFNRRGAI